MPVRVGTFNLNNLFSRFNFNASIDALPAHTEEGGITLSFTDGQFSARTFKGRLVREKDPDDRAEVARRIRDVIDAHVLAVQEVEHIEMLKEFNRDHLGGMYPYVALVEGNDPRLIDVGVLSRLPIGAITSHQTAVHPDDPGQRVFGRDLLQVEILDEQGNKLFNLYNTHLKSHYVPFDEDQEQGKIAANARRRRQAETISRILSRMERRGSRFILTGDMNDPPDSSCLAPMRTADGQDLENALVNATETRPPKAENEGPGPQTSVWTHRFNPTGPEPPRHELYDQIWLSPALADRLQGAAIDRRTKHGGDGSDHDPAWIDLAL